MTFTIIISVDSSLVDYRFSVPVIPSTIPEFGTVILDKEVKVF